MCKVDTVEARKRRHRRVKAGTVYKAHDPVHVVVNKVGPFNNPTETYRYYSLPFCETHHVEENPEDAMTDEPQVQGNRVGAESHHQRLGESIVGDRRETSPYEITYWDEIKYRTLCTSNFSFDDMMKFKEAIHNNWFFEMYIEDLPMWGYVGEIEGEDLILGEDAESKTYLYPHLHFRIGTNNDNIVAVTVTTEEDNKIPIPNSSNDFPTEVQFSYSVEWYEEDEINWRNRMSSYVENRFLPSSFEIHWLSIINSIVLVLLLTAFLVIIFIRVLKDDLSRYMDIEVDEDEPGWKLIHGDVFRFPKYPIIFSAATGTGVQLIASTFVVFALALSGTVSTTRRGSVLAAIVVSYCLLSVVGGYGSLRLYQQMNGKAWVNCILVSAVLFPGPLFLIFSYVNTTALMHGSTSALPVGTIFTITGLYVFLSLPLTVVGGILAKNYAPPEFKAPTRTTKVAREIPTEIPWYRSSKVQFLVSGFLPFSAIYIELNYIFASMWGHHIYTLFGILFLAFSLLLIVTAFISITLLYFQLAREDHRWWWMTFFNGGAVGITIFFYSFVFFFRRSEMNGMLQASFFFGYMTIVSYAFFLMLGSSSFFSCLAFVKYIYSRVKVD